MPDRDAPPLPEEADDLYGLPPAEFTAARNALAKRLKAEGRKEEAAAVTALRRPSPPAWALNQVARQDARVADAVLHTAADLRAAMESALAGGPGGGADLRTAQQAARRAVDAAVNTAAAHLAGAGSAPTDSTRDRLAQTLHAVAADEAVAARFRAGTLADDTRADGFGPELIFAPDARPAPRAAAGGGKGRALHAVPPAEAAGTAEDTVDAAGPAKARQDRLREKADRLEDEAAALRREADEARAAADTAQQDAVAAQEAADEAQRVADEARRASHDARRTADRAARVADEAGERARRAAAAADAGTD